MEKEKKIKIFLGSCYLFIILIFLKVFFNHFSIGDFTSYELIKDHRDSLSEIKNNNIIISSILFFLASVLWVLLLGFASPIFLIGGFVFGKWLGTILVVFGLSSGATLLYILANFFLKDIIKEKFSYKFRNLNHKFKKNEFLFFLIYRFVGGIPFFISNILPTLFNVKVRNFFVGSVIGMTPQLFVGVSLGAGLDKILEKNLSLPTFTSLLLIPDIYIPLIGIIVFIILGFFLKKYYFDK